MRWLLAFVLLAPVAAAAQEVKHECHLAIIQSDCEAASRTFQTTVKRATRGDLAARRTVAQCFTSGCDYSVDTSYLQACAWRRIVLYTAGRAVVQNDRDEENSACSKIFGAEQERVGERVVELARAAGQRLPTSVTRPVTQASTQANLEVVAKSRRWAQDLADFAEIVDGAYGSGNLGFLRNARYVGYQILGRSSSEVPERAAAFCADAAQHLANLSSSILDGKPMAAVADRRAWRAARPKCERSLAGAKP